MDTLIIPDIHTKIKKAQRIIDEHPCGRRVFLGDFFDDFGDTAQSNQETASWLRIQLADPKNTFIWGNHDMHYGFTKNRSFRCSGYMPEKREAINEVMKREDWKKFVLYQEVDGWLISHAGLRHDFADRDLASNAEVALRLADSPDGIQHWMTAAGFGRGGGFVLGGLTWLDWGSEFQPIPGIKQIVGHTPKPQPREREGNWCIDTHLRHAAMLRDGVLEVFAT